MVDEFDGESRSAQDERRLHDRSRLIVDVHFNGEDATGVASTKDISLGGLYMNTQASLPEGAVLTLRIRLGGERQIVVNAEVIYSNPGRGVGVRFKGLSDEDRELMERELPKL
ncbi:MAG TPA: PilZ domain-containing protein [Pyrinomonadaceae bacterium]|nr:PilZ domain-containing protein [Pyrinomonadaceae bacterium]